MNPFNPPSKSPKKVKWRLGKTWLHLPWKKKRWFYLLWGPIIPALFPVPILYLRMGREFYSENTVTALIILVISLYVLFVILFFMSEGAYRLSLIAMKKVGYINK